MVGIVKKHHHRFDYFAVKFGRVGFCARGFLWAAIGGVAASAAFTGENTEGPQGAVELVAKNTGGAVVLAIATIGMFCYAAWRFFEGLYGLRVDPSAPKFMRIINGYVVPFASCLIYIALAISNIVSIINGQISTSDTISISLLKHVAGKIFLQVASLILFGVALGWIVMLLQRKFRSGIDHDRWDRLPRWATLGIYTLAILGTIGRIILFILLAVLLSRTVWDSSVTAGGFGSALKQLQNNYSGKVFIVFIGVLLIIFGLYSCIMSRYKEFLPYKPKLKTNIAPTNDVEIQEDASEKTWMERLKEKISPISEKNTNQGFTEPTESSV